MFAFSSKSAMDLRPFLLVPVEFLLFCFGPWWASSSLSPPPFWLFLDRPLLPLLPAFFFSSRVAKYASTTSCADALCKCQHRTEPTCKWNLQILLRFPSPLFLPWIPFPLDVIYRHTIIRYIVCMNFLDHISGKLLVFLSREHHRRLCAYTSSSPSSPSSSASSSCF